MFTLDDGRDPERLFLKTALNGVARELVKAENFRWRLKDGDNEIPHVISQRVEGLKGLFKEWKEKFRQAPQQEESFLRLANICGRLMYWEILIDLSHEENNLPPRGWTTPDSGVLYTDLRTEQLKLEILEEYANLTKGL